VEVFHKSLKSNASLAKSPTRTLRTQSNHVFLSRGDICAAFKLECLSLKNKLSPFASLPQAAHQRRAISLRRTASTAGYRVTSDYNKGAFLVLKINRYEDPSSSACEVEKEDRQQITAMLMRGRKVARVL
jgi:hypothetical protein